MEIKINQHPYLLEQSCSLQKLFTSVHPIETKGIAVAVNEIIIFKSQWDSHRLKHGDEIMVIKATQGG